MTQLRKADNGDWFARKGIPADVRDAYEKAYGKRYEERFRRPSGVSLGSVKADFRDWDADISAKIERLRAANSNRAVHLTPRQISALGGQWYAWFTDLWADDVGLPEDWESRREMFGAAYERFDLGYPGKDSLPMGTAARRYVDAKIVELGQVETFLAEAGLVLDDETKRAFLDVLESELPMAFNALQRRSGGDFSPDKRLDRFASAELPSRCNVKLSGIDVWQAFEAWVRERQPAASTVERWRGVFLALNEHFASRDVATITVDDAVSWKESLVTEDRSAQTANDTWLGSANTVFKWLAGNKKIPLNPFDGLKFSVPKKIKTREREFERDEWVAILRETLSPPSSRLSASKAACRRWVPWLCAYSGARPGEMTQLQAQRVRQKNGIWYDLPLSFSSTWS